MVIQFPRVTLCFAWKLLQACQNVTLENWMTIIIMLIHWYTYVDSLSQTCVIQIYESWWKLLNKMKSWGHMKFEYKSEMASWNNFQAKHYVTAWKLDDHYYHVNTVIHLC